MVAIISASPTGAAVGYDADPALIPLAACALSSKIVVTAYHGFLGVTHDITGIPQLGQRVQVYAILAKSFMDLSPQERTKLHCLMQGGAVKGSFFVAEAHDRAQRLGQSELSVLCDGPTGYKFRGDWVILKLNGELDLPAVFPRPLFEEEAFNLATYMNTLSCIVPSARALVLLEGIAAYYSAGEVVGDDNATEVRLTYPLPTSLDQQRLRFVRLR